MAVFDLTIRLHIPANDKNHAQAIGMAFRGPDGNVPWQVEVELANEPGEPHYDLTVHLRVSASDRDHAVAIGREFQAPDGTDAWEVEADPVNEADSPGFP